MSCAPLAVPMGLNAVRAHLPDTDWLESAISAPESKRHARAWAPVGSVITTSSSSATRATLSGMGAWDVPAVATLVGMGSNKAFASEALPQAALSAHASSTAAWSERLQPGFPLALQLGVLRKSKPVMSESVGCKLDAAASLQ